MPRTRNATRSGARAVGRPAPIWLVGAFLQSSLVLGLAAAVALGLAADNLARGTLGASDVLLAVHLFGLGFLPFAVAGAALHVLPILLRNSVPLAPAALAFVLLWGGPVLAVAIARDRPGIARPSAGAVAAALFLLAALVGKLVVAAPRGRLLLASRAGIVLSTANGVLAFSAGGLLLERGARPFLGIPHERLIAIHLHLAVLGWLTLLILTVARTLAPMLALAASARPRRLPSDELTLAAGLWAFLAGIAVASRVLALVGSLAVLYALASFIREMARVARSRQLPALEAPLVHFVLGITFLGQAFVLGLVLVGTDPSPREFAAYTIWLLLGWAGGVTLGHVGKLLALSAWTSWPRGPRPKQAWFYPRRLWLLVAVAFALGLDVLALGVLAGDAWPVLAGALLIGIAMSASVAAAVLTLARAPRRAASTDQAPDGPSERALERLHASGYPPSRVS